MARSDGSSRTTSEITAAALAAVARELGVGQRQLEDWRERGLVPRPRRAGYQGKRPIWLYPAHAEAQLRAAVRLRKGTRDLDAIKVALWAEGFPIPLDELRESLFVVVARFERALVDEVTRFAPSDHQGTNLVDDPQALDQALEGYADELARLRSRQPFKRRARLTLAQRQRAFLYMLAPFFGVDQNADDALLAERLYGITRGRSGTAGGDLLEPPQSYVGVRPLSGREMREAIETADLLSFALVQGGLETFLKLFPTLVPIFVASVPALQPFVQDAIELLSDLPAPLVAVFAAALLTNVQRRRATEELTPELVQQIRPGPMFTALVEAFDDEQREAFLEAVRSKN